LQHIHGPYINAKENLG